MPFGVDDDDLRVQVPLVLDDRPPDVARGIDLDFHRFVFDDVVESDLAADLGQDRNVVRVPLAEHAAAADRLAVFDHHDRTVGNVVFLELATLGVEDLDLAVTRQRDLLPFVVDHDVQADELDLALALALDVLFLDAAGGDAADVERAHRELRAGLADRLGADDPDGHAHLDQLPGGQVHAVTAAANPQRRFAGHRAADLDLLDLHFLELLGGGQGDHLAIPDHDLIGERVNDIDPADAATDRLHEADLDLFALVDDPLGDALRGAAVFHGDHDVLGDVGQFSGQVAAIGRLQGRIGQALAGPVGRAEILEHRQPFAEVGLDRGLDDLARRLGHESPHAGQLADLLDAAAGTRLGHQEDRIQVDLALAAVVAQGFHHLGRDALAGVRPRIQHLVIPLLVGDDAALVEPVLLGDLFLGLGDDGILRRRRFQVVGRKRQP